MASIEILNEQERPGGWDFQVRVADERHPEQLIRLSLAWADYNLWSPDGGDAPERVAEAVLAFLLHRQDAAALRPAFDAAVVRRLFPDADEAIPRLVRRAP